jgi:hypothetical protein
VQLHRRLTFYCRLALALLSALFGFQNEPARTPSICNILDLMCRLPAMNECSAFRTRLLAERCLSPIGRFPPESTNGRSISVQAIQPKEKLIGQGSLATVRDADPLGVRSVAFAHRLPGLDHCKEGALRPFRTRRAPKGREIRPGLQSHWRDVFTFAPVERRSYTFRPKNR